MRDDGETGPGPRAGHVLVIDDEESMRHAVVRGLERAGFRCTAAATGREGVDCFVGGGFDAVLTDVRLPDLSGLDVVAVLTEMDPGVPVVVMTGYGTMDTALDAMRRGARDYVAKPFVVGDVVQVLRRAIAERRLSRENRRLRALVERRLDPGAFASVEAELQEHQDAGAGPEAGARPVAGRGALTALLGEQDDGTPLELREAQRRFEVAYVSDLLARTGGNVAAAARLAGISRPNFHKKLRALEVDAGRFKQAARRGRLRDL
jgi:DNA-binding NtrC family response regulator